MSIRLRAIVFDAVVSSLPICHMSSLLVIYNNVLMDLRRQPLLLHYLLIVANFIQEGILSISAITVDARVTFRRR